MLADLVPIRFAFSHGFKAKKIALEEDSFLGGLLPRLQKAWLCLVQCEPQGDRSDMEAGRFEVERPTTRSSP